MLRAMTQADGQEQGSRWRWLFRHRPAFNAMIPPDARVDPDRFPEEEFPLYCPKCDYLLRGLPGNRCPECGQAFDRGRLLVEQYVIQQGKPTWPPAKRYAKKTAVIGLILLLASLLLVIGDIYSMFHHLRRLLPVSVVKIAMGFAAFAGLVVLSASLVYSYWPDPAKKSRQVFDAIDQTSESYRRAQRWGQRVWLVIFVPFAAYILYDLCAAGCYAHGYYSQHPEAMLPAVGIGLGAGALIVGIHALVARLYRRHIRDKR